MFCTRSHDQQNALMFFNFFTWTAECCDGEKTASNKKRFWRTWKGRFCTNDMGVSSVSSPYRVQIVSRGMKKPWYLTNSRRCNIHRALKNNKGDEHDQPFLLSGCNAETRDQRGLKGLSVSQFFVSFTGYLAGSHGYKNSIWDAFLKKIRREEILKAPAEDKWPAKCQVKKQAVLLSKHLGGWRVFSSI